MPVTRSEGRGRKVEQTPSSSEDTTGTSATGTTAETATESTVTGTAATESTETTATTAPSTAASATAATRTAVASATALAPSAAPSDTTTLPADAILRTDMKPPTVPGRKNIVSARKEIVEQSEASTVRRVLKSVIGQPVPHSEPNPCPPSKKGERGGSTKSRSKAHRIAKAKEELKRLQVELAEARLASLETEDTEDEAEEEEVVSICSKTEVNDRVDTWLENQHSRPLLAITEGAPAPIEEVRVTQQEYRHPTEHVQQIPAGGQLGLQELTAAITQAIKSSHHPKVIELPFFNGAYQDWLPFRAAYYETEHMFTAVENTNRLRRNLKGKAKEAVEGLLITSTHPADIMKGLEVRFGRPESIATAEVENLRNLPRLTDAPRDLCILSMKVSNVAATLRTLNCVNYLYNPEVAKIILDRLTPSLHYRYYDFIATQRKEDPDLLKMERFLKKEAELCAPFATPEKVAPHVPVTQYKKPQKIHNVTDKPNTSKCPVCEETGHYSIDCGQFKNADENRRWEIAKNKYLCFRCLRYRNKAHSCKPRPCGVNSCKNLHHKLLHYEKREQKPEDKEEKEVINTAWTMNNKQSYLKIIPVRVKGPRGTAETYALMDDGSTVTLIDDDIVSQIGATGPIDPLKIESINKLKTSEVESRRVNVNIEGLNKKEQLMQARTVKNLQVSSQRVSRRLIEGCEHLKDISQLVSYAEVKPQILIGQDNWHLLLTSKTKKGNRNQPVASLTPLGWVLHGSHTRTIGRQVDFVSHLTEPEEDDLENLVKQHFEMDALCIAPKKPKTDPEEQALRILEKVTKKTEEGRYETGLLWNKEDVNLPDNYDNALKRLFNIEKKIDKDPKLKQKYTEQMEALTAKGYAELAPTEKTPRKTWYLPHFAVINPMKPEKLRVVHDAAAKTRGVALNDMLLKGPDLLQSLPGVVMRFRQHKIAVTADIKEMFMQVKLREEDRDALRYLWRGNRRDDQPPEEYRMTSLIFGASSSPSTAIYVKNLNATRHKDTHPEAAAAIIKKHYVDDYLDSFRSLEEAEHIVKGVREVHADASFELKQWKSNSPQLLQTLGERSQTEHTEIYKSEEKTERVLGLIWKPNSDVLTFNLNLTRIPPSLIEGKTPTKREALRVVMSLFDPLGFASPVTIRAKQILQEVWRRGTSWDDKIDQDLAELWAAWITHLKNLCNVAIPRQYLHYSDAVTVELHVFTDASESAYSAVLYWRLTTPDNAVNVSLIVAKARVAPLKLTSIPRLELQAAVMGTRIAEAVIEEHTRKPDRKTFWTDSKTVLTWIRTGSRSYKPYVAHRLAAIEDANKVKDWRWVPTKMNVADDATRDVPATFGQEHRWYNGPGRVQSPGQFTERDTVNRNSWRCAQRLADIFWTRWVKEYLPELQHRREPHGRGPVVRVNDLVQVVDSNAPRNVWIRGRVIKTYPGPDDIVRTVDIRTKGGVLRRPVRKLVVLPLTTDDVPAPEDNATK